MNHDRLLRARLAFLRAIDPNKAALTDDEVDDIAKAFGAPRPAPPNLGQGKAHQPAPQPAPVAGPYAYPVKPTQPSVPAAPPPGRGEKGGRCAQPTCSFGPASFKDKWTGEFLCQACAEDRNRRARSLHGPNVEPYCTEVVDKAVLTESPIVNLSLDQDAWDNAWVSC